MADHEEDAPDVDYEGEEEEDEHNVGEQPIVEGIKGAGDSETDDDAEEGASSTNKQQSEGNKKGGAGDSETESEGEEEDGEINKGKASTSKKSSVSIMDKPLSAPREKPQNTNTNQRGGEGGNTRGNRWGERNTNNGRGAMKQSKNNVGVYIPPAKRRLLEEQRKAQLEAEAETSGSKSTSSPTKQITPLNKQQESWTNLQRTINGTINRLSPTTLKPLIHQLFSEANLIKGRGILTKSILNASIGSMQYTSTYASLISVINSKLPEVGELLLTRAILSFRKGYKYRNMNTVSSTLSLLGHMFNQNIAHELLSLQILSLLLDGEPTDDSVDVAVSYMCIVGKQLTEVSPNGVHAIMERFRGLLHEGTIGRRGQYRIETLLKIKKGKFINYPTILPELDLVELDDQITFDSIGLDDDDLEYDEQLDVFHYDEDYDEKEEEWNVIKKEILGDDSDSSSDDESGSGSGSESSDDEEEEDVPDQQLIEPGSKKTVVIEDLTETDLVHLRRTIYLTIMSSATFEECAHKLAKMDIPPGKECELINMIIECCSQERTFLRYYGLVSARFCLLNERWQLAFEEAFATQYNTIHRLETNKLRNVAKLFGHLLHTDSVSWSVLGCIHLNEDETTSSSRIFIKILVQEMAEAMGMVTLKQRFDTDNPEPDGELGDNGEATSNALAVSNNNRQGYGQQQQQEASSREWFKGMFPKDNARNTRYAINFFTSIGLGPLTDGMREFLKNAPKLILAQAKAAAAREAAQKEKDDDESSVISSSSSDTSSASSSSSSSSSSYTSSSSSSYSSDSRNRRSNKSSRGRKRGRSRRRSRSYSSSSSSSSGSSDSSDSRSRKKRKYSSKSSKRPSSRDSRRSSENDNDNASKATSTGSKRRRSVSSSRGHKKRDRSSSRSNSPSARKESSRSSRNEDDGGDRKRSRRARSDSRSMSSGRK